MGPSDWSEIRGIGILPFARQAFGSTEIHGRIAAAQSFKLNDTNADRVGAGENIGRASLPQKKLSYQA